MISIKNAGREGYQICENNSAKVDSGDGWGDYLEA